jgi:hypothetical protein
MLGNHRLEAVHDVPALRQAQHLDCLPPISELCDHGRYQAVMPGQH